MNINEAKEQIKYAVKAYLTKNEYGELMIPIESQRPIFLMGAPGIRKNSYNETNSRGIKYRASFVFNDTSHKTKCIRTSYDK